MARRFSTVLLDVDGTLVDSNDAHAQSWVDVLRDEGFDVDVARVRRLIGEGGDKLLPTVTGLEDDSPRGKRISEARWKRFRDHYLPSLRPFPQAAALLARLRAMRYQLVIATSARDEELRLILRVVSPDAESLLDEKTTSDDADRSKPDPDIVHAALARAGCGPDEAVMIGDTPYDVEAAGRAGVAAIALRSGGWPDAELADAIAIFDDAADLLAHLDASPLADHAAIDSDGARHP